jgi:peptidoglycan/LPS O-acetylase OafA/YrhL
MGFASSPPAFSLSIPQSKGPQMMVFGNRLPKRAAEEMNQRNKIHLPFLDGIRGIAILGVFFFHSLHATFGFDNLKWNGIYRDFNVLDSFLALYPFTYGGAGVAIFFVVSGFCIHLSHQRSKDGGWLSFANRRFFRIYPPYLLALLFFFFVSPWGSFHLNSISRIHQLTTHVLAIHNFDENMFFGINPSFWSIAVEVQLYALYPLLLLLAGRLGWKRALLIVGCGEVWIRLVVAINSLASNDPVPWFIQNSPFAFWLSWSLGAYLCECSMHQRSSRIFALPFWLVLGVAFAVPFFRFTSPFTFLAFSLLTAIAIERLMTQKWTLPSNDYFRTLWAHLSLLGVISYSFYLIHQPIIELTGKVIERVLPGTFIHPLLKYSLCLAWYPLLFLFSLLLYRFIEQPSIRLGKVVWRIFTVPNARLQGLARRQR